MRRPSTSASPARHHAEWLSLVETSGPFLSLPVLLRVFPNLLDAHDPDQSQRLRTAFGEWEAAVEGPDYDQAYHQAWLRFVLTDVLELPAEVLAEGQQLPPGLEAKFAEHGETLRPDLAVVDPNTHQPCLLVQFLKPRESPEKPLPDKRWKASPATRMMELLHATDVKLGLVTNGEQWLLVHAPRGETTGFASWYAHLWLEEQLTLRAFRSLLGVHRFFSAAETDTLAAMLADSSQDQQEVTDQLGYQVRKAVEVLVQAIDRVDQDRRRALLAGFDEHQLYEAALTIMMRLVFLFSAEERGLLLLGDALYDQNYAVSTLRAQLRETADQLGEEILERRRDAWTRLLATFRAVHGGVQHDRMRLPAYGGALFDPDRFPFLEGRPAGTHWQDSAALPLPIHNRTVLHLLEALQILQVKVPGGGPAEARRLSFRALDIEQIGHVYEGLLDHGAVRAKEPVVGLTGTQDKEPELLLSQLEALAVSDPVELVNLVKKETGRSVGPIRKALALLLNDEEQTLPESEDSSHLLAACGNDPELCNRVRPFAALLREDTEGLLVVIPAGGVYVTQTGSRRESGTHYTPRSLTEPIVRHALDPLVYHGPAEGLPPEQWQLHSAAEILDLKICDFAMGSGAFLVQTCRYLSERLVEAWEMAEQAHPGQVVITPEGQLSSGAADERPLPQDAEERLAIARRAVADVCLYGVDKNPMAVEMAKLSLWLITLQKDRPFTFLNHALKHGDSLVGLTDPEQLATWSLDRSGSHQLSLFMADPIRQAKEKRRQVRELPERDIYDVQKKERLHAEAERLMQRLKLAADLLVAPEFGIEQVTERANEAVRFQGEFVSFQREDDYLPRLRAKADELLGDVTPFHWCLEFPEVFEEEQSGFDAVVGNPPFTRGKSISTVHGSAYREALVRQVADGARGSADLSVYFLLRGCQLTRAGGATALIVSKTVAEGESREVGLLRLLEDGARVQRAVASQPWPGSASVQVALLWVRTGGWRGPCWLDDSIVTGITSHLARPGAVIGEPYVLAANQGLSYQGSNIVGMGFVLEPAQAHQLISQDPRNADVVMPYLVGRDLNSSPDQSPSRWAINFFDWPERRAAEYSRCWEIIERLVKPERQRRNSKGEFVLRSPQPERYWQYAERCPALYSSIAGMRRVLVIAQTSSTLSPAMVPLQGVIGHKVIVFVADSYAWFALLGSSPHRNWTLLRGSTLRTDPVYTPTKCFGTFPFPLDLSGLELIGESYHEHRRQVMLDRWEGLTKTYNRFHDPGESSSDIVELRWLHVEMDQAVALAYGWADLDLGHGFHETKQGLRYTVSDPARRELLDRLLALNHERYEAEVRQGLHEKKKPRGKKRGGRKKPPKDDGGQGSLF